MRKKIVWCVIFCLVSISFISIGTTRDSPEEKLSVQTYKVNTKAEQGSPQISDDSSVTIISPQAGYFYCLQLSPIQMPIPRILGLQYAVIVGRTLNIEMLGNNIHHVKCVATRLLTGWETVRWDYQTIDGLGMDFSLSSGVYTVTVTGYDDTDTELGQDSIKVLYLKVGREDFGVWVQTKYDNGEAISTPLQLGLSDFSSMLNTGESKQFKVSVQNKEDTDLELRFIRTKIMNNTQKVIETKCNIFTTCDTSKQYEVSVEVRFPFIMLDGGQPSQGNNPYFSTKFGYQSVTGNGDMNRINTTMYIGRESINDPRVFRVSITPKDIESDSKLTFFAHYRTMNSTGDELFQRTYSIDFEPATELTVTSIPREAKISYEFGKSAGKTTKISLRAEGGMLDDIIQSFTLDPLPSFMAFDLTLLGSREFIYESNQAYDVSYALNSKQEGNLVVFKVSDLPEKIHASWSLALGKIGDLAASSVADLDMSREVSRISLYFWGNDQPFFSLQNLPKKIRIENHIDLLNGTGMITVFRALDEQRTVNVSVHFQDMVVQKSFELKNNFMQMSWKIDAEEGTGFLEITRDSESTMTLSTTISYQDWMVQKTLELKNTRFSFSWDINRESRTGEIIVSREDAGGSPLLTYSISHDGWILADTIELTNPYLEIFWQLPTQTRSHAQLGVITKGGEIIYNTISLIDNDVKTFSLGCGIQTDDHFILSWDYANGEISNFVWSGKLLRLSDVDLAVNLAGELFTMNAECTFGEKGALEIECNKPVAVTFAESKSDRCSLKGDVSIYAERRLQIHWELGESGQYSIYTFSEPLGDVFSLEVGYDPQQTGNYRYGFRLTGENFIDITRTIQWYAQDGSLVRIWVLGDLPLPGDWSLQVLWDNDWYPVPWP